MAEIRYGPCDLELLDEVEEVLYSMDVRDGYRIRKDGCFLVIDMEDELTAEFEANLLLHLEEKFNFNLPDKFYL